MELGYFPGCTLHSSSALYDGQCRRVLEALGVTLREIPDWNCCGATSAAKTDDFLAVALPARNLGLAVTSGLRELFIPCSSCYSRTVVAQKQLAENPELLREINAQLERKVVGPVQILSILEVLVPLAKSGKLAEKVQKRLAGLKPACYYGCLLTRFPCDAVAPDNVENPQGMETILRGLGASPLDWSYKTDCCGASATMNDTAVAFGLMAKIMKEAVLRGANCFVTTCPMCQLNLDAYQAEVRKKLADVPGAQKPLPVYFITELIGLALGMNPTDLQIDRHLVDGLVLLKELKIT